MNIREFDIAVLARSLEASTWPGCSVSTEVMLFSHQGVKVQARWVDHYNRIIALVRLPGVYLPGMIDGRLRYDRNGVVLPELTHLEYATEFAEAVLRFVERLKARPA